MLFWLFIETIAYAKLVCNIVFSTVRLIHGKGTGALKKALWNYLRTDGRISSYRIGAYGEGDGGVTVVKLK